MSSAVHRELLELCAQNFGKKSAWIEDCLALWSASPTISRASDADLKEAVVAYLEEGQYAPKVADIAQRLKVSKLRAVGPSVAACQDCGGTGWREGVAHFQEADGVRIEGPVALVCGCRPQKGVPYEQWLRQQEGKPGFIGHFHTGKQYPRIPDEWRLTATQLARLAELRSKANRPKGQVLAFNPSPVDVHARDRARLAKQAARVWSEPEEEAV